MTHELKYKVGDRVRVIASKYDSWDRHNAVIGETYTIDFARKESRKGGDPKEYQEYRLEGPYKPWVAEDEIELAYEVPAEATVLSNAELFEAIDQTYWLISDAHRQAKIFDALHEHLEALLKEHQRRAETRLHSEQEKPC